MPELPEVQTTVDGLNNVLPKLKIGDVWSDYPNPKWTEDKNGIKSKKYFNNFKKEIAGKKIINAERRGKNVLINLSENKTILIHLRMTGHLLYGEYKQEKNKWIPTEKNTPLSDPYNRFTHLVFSLSNKKHLLLSDARKFAKVLLLNTDKLKETEDISKLGPEALNGLSFEKLKERLLKRPKAKIKEVLMDQEIIAGIGNIYSDEILWQAETHPEEMVSKITNKQMREIFKATKEILERSIKLQGDSMSDYRNINGEKGGYQNFHKAYRNTGKNCVKKGCKGIIKRIKVGGRSAHFCSLHQKLSI